jgi:peptidoglycan/LPS O-acetylase OafA/YrhL
VNTPATTAPRHSTLGYLPGLDGLRAISVLAVIFFHQYFVYGSERGFMPGGFLGVEVFFVVSGYLITSLILADRRETGRISLRHFWTRRARRLLPAVYVLLAVVVAYSLLFLPDSIATLKGDVIAALTYTSNWWQIIANRSYFVAAGRPELLKQLWSLAIEEQFYLFWPPLLMLGLAKLGRSRTLAATIAVAIISTILLAVIAVVSINFAYYATFTRLSGLLLGSAMAFFYAPYHIRRRAAPRARAALNLAGAVGLAVLLLSFHTYTFPEANTGAVDRSVFFGGFLIVDLATLLVIAAVVHPVADWGRVLGVRPLRYVGTRSYSLYLWHWPIFCVTRPRVDFRDFFHLHGWPVFALRLVLSFGAAELSYRFVETPIRSGALGRYRDHLRRAHGVRKRLLVRRGVFVAASLTLVALMLGAGLANAQPQTEPNVASTNGAVADPSALAALRSTSTSATTTTVHATTPTSKKPSATTTTTTVHASASLGKVLAIGDSVMLGARSSLQRDIPDIAVDAVVSRQVGQAPGLLSYYRAQGLLPRDVVVGLGTNGRATPGIYDAIMNAAGPGHIVYFLTARVPRVWEAETNQTILDGSRRWKNSQMIDWRSYAGCHDDWFVNDGFHLTTAGQHAYAAFILSRLKGGPNLPCK